MTGHCQPADKSKPAPPIPQASLDYHHMAAVNNMLSVRDRLQDIYVSATLLYSRLIINAARAEDPQPWLNAAEDCHRIMERAR